MVLPHKKLEIMGVRHCYIEYNVSSILTFKRVWMTNKCQLTVDNAKLEYSGDGQKWTRMYGYMASGTIAADVDDTDLDAILWPVAATSPTGGDDFTYRIVKGSRAEMGTNFVGLRISMDAIDGDTGALCVVRTRILKAQFDPSHVDDMATETKQGRILAWNARPATTDIVGGAMTGVPATGAFWVKDVIEDNTKFDPVAEVY